jgi:hypothetical protein
MLNFLKIAIGLPQKVFQEGKRRRKVTIKNIKFGLFPIFNFDSGTQTLGVQK